MEEDNLDARLVPPQEIDDPNRPITRGEQQPSGCRDAWAAILFYAQAIAVVSVCVIFGVPALNKQISSTDQQNQQDDSLVDYREYAGIGYLVVASTGCAFVLSGVSLAIMSCCPRFLIQFSLLFSVAMSGIMMILSFISGVIIGGIVGLVFFALSVCYAKIVWKRIPFAAANLTTSLTAVKSNAGLFVMSYLFVFLTWVYTCVWFVALFGVYDATGVVDENGELTENNIVYAYFFLLLLAIFWSEQVIQNTMHAIVAGVVSTWWFVPEEANHCCSKAIMDSTVRATTTSFGSICFGSLLVAIIQTLKSMCQNARNNNDMDACAAFLLCLVECCLRCLEDILEYFNKFAFIYVGMYGYSYLEAGKNVMTLFKQKGWTVIVNDDLIQNTLSLFNLIVGLLVGGFGVAMKELTDWLVTMPDDVTATVVAFSFPFLIGVIISAVMFSIVDSSVNTVIVCFAEAPAEFESNHPELSMEMRDGWRKVYPEECGF